MVVVGSVARVSTLVPAAAVIVTDAGVNEQVGTDIAPVGPVTAQVKATAPVKPPLGVTVTVLVPDVPGELILTVVPATAIAGAVVPLTVSARDPVAVVTPVAAALTATVYAPAVVVEVVATVRVLVAATLVIVTDAGANEQVGSDIAPAGPVTAQLSATAPVNPPPGVTVIVLVPEAPGATAAKLDPETAIVGWVIATTTNALAFAYVASVAGE